jgi:DNA-binding PadR family transcriptional regulator
MDISDMSASDLKPAALHILLALVEGDAHGYALLQSARGRDGSGRPLQTASFYRHLSVLIDQGLVVEIPRPADVDARRGAYYRLTARGRSVLLAERKRMSALVAEMRTLRASPKKGVL